MKLLFRFVLLVAISVLFQLTASAQFIGTESYLDQIFITDIGGNCGEGQSQQLTLPFTGTILHLIVNTQRLQQNFPTSIVFSTINDANGVYLGGMGYGFHSPDHNYPTVDLYSAIHHAGDVIIPPSNQPTTRPWMVTVTYVETVIENRVRRDISHPLEPFTFDPADYLPACARLPYLGVDTNGNTLPINEGNSDNEVAVYTATDDNGEPALHIYDINDDGDGTLALEITQDIIAPYIDNPPSENTALMTSDNGKVTLYVLDTGELQINSGPDAEGKTHVLIFDGIPPTNIYGYVIDPPLFP